MYKRFSGVVIKILRIKGIKNASTDENKKNSVSHSHGLGF